MHFNLLSLSGIKTMAGEFQLAPVTVISGPNEAGKSALLEALRLAVTGSAQIGGKGQAVAEMMPGDNAHALVMAGGDMCEWRCRIGDSVSQKRSGRTDMQGNVPVSVEDFNALSSAQKFALVGKDNLTTIVGEIENVKDEIKRLKAIANAPPPAMPDPYDGKPLQELEADLNELVLAIANHKKASEGIAERTAARNREEERLARVKTEKNAKSIHLAQAKKELDKLVSERDILSSLVARYDAAAKEAPTLIEWGRRKNYDSRALVDNLCRELSQACKYMALAAGREGKLAAQSELEICMEQLRRISCEHAIALPQPQFERDDELWAIVGKTAPASALAALNVKLQDAKQLATNIEHEYNVLCRAEHAHEQSLGVELAIYGEPLSAEALESIVNQKLELEQAIEKCKKWEGWDVEAGKHAVQTSSAVTKMYDLDDKLSLLNKQRAEIVESVTGPLEEMANATLARANLPPLSVTVEATAKTAQLVVRTEQGIQIAALAKSRRLAYSIALLSAIGQLSSAPCPLLVAECAELDGPAFESLAGALSPEKGNIVLEHHLPCRIGHVINLREELVAA